MSTSAGSGSPASLIATARAGSPDALAALYLEYGARLFRLAFRLVDNREDAEDVVHDVFVGLPEALGRYEERGNLTSWLKRVTARVALMRLRARPMLHARLVQQYSHDSVNELLYLSPPPKERERTLRGAAVLRDLAVGPMLVSWSPHSLEVLVQALSLSGAWRGSVYSANWVTMATRFPTFTALDLRVTGTERVTVPAGTFDCWRLEEREGDEKSVLWVSQDQGWLVMRRQTSSDGSGKFRTEWVNETRLVAVDTLPTPPAP